MKLLNSTTITISGKPYLTRYYLFGRDRKWFNIYIHHFHSSDQGDELHNHPWHWAISLLLLNGYKEEVRTADNEILQRTKTAISLNGIFIRGLFRSIIDSVNFITNNDFHRVDLLDEKSGTWSIFIAGPRTGEWGFWNRHSNKFKDWRENPEAIP